MDTSDRGTLDERLVPKGGRISLALALVLSPSVSLTPGQLLQMHTWWHSDAASWTFYRPSSSGISAARLPTMPGKANSRSTSAAPNKKTGPNRL